jgi:nicotinamide mononucleotide transporter
LQSFLDQVIDIVSSTHPTEFIAVIFGIASVWFSKKENILVYPVGLVNTIMYVYISFNSQLFGEAAVNLYYTIMSIYGWIVWAKKDEQRRKVVLITRSDRREWVQQLLFFAFCYVVIFIGLRYLKQQFAPGALPAADAFASATAFTGMWLMAKKKVESWYWWIATNIASIPLFYIKDLKFTSFYYLVLLILAIAGLQEWRRKAVPHHQPTKSASW